MFSVCECECLWRLPSLLDKHFSASILWGFVIIAMTENKSHCHRLADTRALQFVAQNCGGLWLQSDQQNGKILQLSGGNRKPDTDVSQVT